jgi:peroxiredoxin family protein
MTIIVTKGSLDWAYPPFILATTAAALGVDVTMFFTFYGLPLLLKKLDLQISSLGNPAMKMPLFGQHTEDLREPVRSRDTFAQTVTSVSASTGPTISPTC